MGVPKRHLKAVDGSGFAPDPWEQRFRLLAGSVRALVSVHDAAGSFPVSYTHLTLPTILRV